MSQFFTLLTKTGQGLLANAIAYGQPLTIATMAIGDGGGKLPTPDASTTRLINEVRRGPINQTSVDANNPNWTVVEQVLPPDVGGWTIREVGLYDTEGNLIAYGNYPETYKPQLSEGSSRTQTIRFIMEVTDTSAVTLRIDPSVVMASRKYVDDAMTAHEKSRNHPDADTKNSGMMRFATLAESKKGEEAKAAQTPAGGKAQLDDHRNEEAAHKAEQITITEQIRQVSDAKTVAAALAGLGDFAAAGLQNIAVFDAAGFTDWPVPDVLQKGLRLAWIDVIGGGGSGAKYPTGRVGGGGGGPGGDRRGFVNLTGVDSVPITVGAGAPGVGKNVNSNLTGLDGGTSSFGSFMTATGGKGGGTSNGNPGYPGEGHGEGYSMGMTAAGPGRATEAGNPSGGTGGGPGGIGYRGTIYPPTGPGGGGGGIGGDNDVSSESGAGRDGIVIVRW